MAKVYGGWPYNLVQMGRETTPGTPVAATTVWRGVFASPEDDRQRQVVEENVGILIPAERSYDTMLGVNIPFPATPITYEQILHLLEAGIETPSPSGAGPYTRVYDYPTSGVNTIKTYTLEVGNTLVSADVQQIPYAFVNEMTFEGKSGEAWMMSGTWRGQRLLDIDFTAAIAIPTDIEDALFGNTRLYIDATGGTIGTTQYTGVLMGASIKITTGIQQVPVGDGNLYSTGHKFVRPEITFSLTYELEQDTGVSLVGAQRTIQEANTVQLFRLHIPGSSAARDIKFDFAGKYDKVGPYTNENGNTTVTFDGHAVYSSADSLFWKATVINSLATVP